LADNDGGHPAAAAVPEGAHPDYDTADAYGPPDGYDTADAYGPPDGYGAGDAFGPLGGFRADDDFRPPGDYGSGDTHGPPGHHGAVDTFAAATGYDNPVTQDPPRPLLGSSGHHPGGPPGQFGSPEGSPEAGRAQGAPAAGLVSATPPAAPVTPDAPAAPVTPDAPAAPPAGGHATPQHMITADSLTADLLLPGRHKAPSGGWRRAIFEVTGGLVRAPESAAQRRRRELTARARTPVSGGHHRVAVLSLKGGVGKTTTTMGLGSMLASLRGDRVIAVDANPDRGTLSDKLRLETAATVRDLLNERAQIQRYADVRAYTTQAPSRLEVLASDRDPTVSVAFSEQDFCAVAQVLEHYYSICITDCGTGLLHSAMTGVLRLADQIVLVSSPSVDGARSASATFDWLQAHSYGDLVRNAVVVLSVVRPRSRSGVDLDRLEQHFAARCRGVVKVPFDPHLEEGAEVDLARLNRATADAYLALAAEIGDGFARPQPAGR